MDRTVSRGTRSKQVNTTKRRKSKFFIGSGYLDYQSVFLILTLLMFGLVMVYSSSSYRATMNGLESTYYFKRQLMAIALGLFAMWAVSHVNYRKLAPFSKIFLMVSTALVLYTKFFGVNVNGSSRWIKIGPIQFQPSEIAKIAIIVYVSHVCVVYSRNLSSLPELIKLIILPAACAVVIAIENLSSAIICILILGAIIYVACPNFRNILVLMIAGVVFVYIFIAFVGYRGDRIEAWKNPETSENGFQTMQSLYAIGSGGLFGRGLGNSIQKMGFLPESHNDMIFSVICEELGIVGAFGVIILFIMLLINFKRIADNSPDSFGGFIVTGVMTHIAVQTLVNIAVVTNSIPNTGVTLPFVSYGGTSIAILLAEMGLVLSVSRQTKLYDRMD